MELEEAIETIKNSYVMSTKHFLDDKKIKLKQAIKIVLQALDKEKYFNKIHGYHMKYNFIPKKKIEELIENETINISGFKCISSTDIQELLEDK